MGEIVQIADAQKVDVVIIAGDLFDNFTPNTDAIELFYKTVKQLSLGGRRPVVAISGNHDAPKLIDAPDPLARECGIFLIRSAFCFGNPYRNTRFQNYPFLSGLYRATTCLLPLPLANYPYCLCQRASAKRRIGRRQTTGYQPIPIRQMASSCTGVL